MPPFSFAKSHSSSSFHDFFNWHHNEQCRELVVKHILHFIILIWHWCNIYIFCNGFFCTFYCYVPLFTLFYAANLNHLCTDAKENSTFFFVLSKINLTNDIGLSLKTLCLTERLQHMCAYEVCFFSFLLFGGTCLIFEMNNV